jgi:phosphoribosylformimino-5-aminoimidazole carboxamide ribotide isomerase
MLIIPAIDIKDNKCVRVFKGLHETTQYYSESPITVAKLFRKENFKTIHITDLDGVRYGEMKNYDTIKKISDSVDIPIQLGGGIRNFDIAKKMFNELGVYRIVIGSGAITNPDMLKQLLKEYSSSKIIVGIDEKLNNVVSNGWINLTNITPLDFAKQMESLGVSRIIYQDVTRVGNLSGPNVERLIEISENTNLKITAAGGVRNYKDLKKIRDLKIKDVDSVLISRALYENQFPCQNLWRDLEREDTSLELPKVN